MKQIVFIPAARKELRKLPQGAQTDLLAALDAVAKGGGDVAKIAGTDDLYRVKPGGQARGWRALVAFEGDVVVVLIATRGEVYRMMKKAAARR
jgi:mRNA-degrading endonuclease RelE of RelBE toxin-antitoxin system